MVGPARALEPGEKAAGIDHNLTRRVQFYVCSIHRPRRWPLEVHTLGGIAAAMARALEFVLGRFPVRGAAKMRALREDTEQARRLFDHPNAKSLFVLLVDSDLIIRRVSDGVNRIGFEQGSWEKEAQEH